MNENNIKTPAIAMREMILNAVVFGDTLKAAKAIGILGDMLADQGIGELEARVSMSSTDQFTSCIRSGMGVNQALTWMAEAGWAEKIGNHIIKRIGA